MNKKILSIEEINKQNNQFHKFIIIMIPITCFAIVFLVFIDCALMSFIPLVFLFRLIILKKNLNTCVANIANGNFKIVEDKIYDKYYVHHIQRNSNSFSYYVCSKIYGNLLVDSTEYKQAQKDDSIYILIYNVNKDNGKKQSYKIDGKYLASLYDIDDKLKKHFIPYNEFLGESNFNNRVKDMFNELKEKSNMVVCESCSMEYKLKKHDVCPHCYSIYKYNIKDVVHQKDWY